MTKSFNYIFTTNWDNLLENVNSKLKAISIRSQFEKIEEIRKKENAVVKFHGDIFAYGEEHGDPLIISKTDYWNRILSIDNPFDILFKHDLIHSIFIFIGYGFNDPNIQMNIYQILKLTGLMQVQKVIWTITEYRSDPRAAILSKHSNIQPVYLLSEANESELISLENEINKACQDCKIKNKQDCFEVSAKECCSRCDQVDSLKSTIKEKKGEYINTGLNLLINEIIN